MGALAWTDSPGAGRYRVTLMDAAGTAIWRGETADTVALVPDSIQFATGVPYFWKVEAETAWDRWVSSEQLDFTLRGPRR